MKRSICFFIFLFTLSFFNWAAYIGRLQVSDPNRPGQPQPPVKQALHLEEFLNAEIGRGNLVLHLVQQDNLLPGRTFQRYRQYHNGLPVFGGEVVRQYENGRLLGSSGEYFEIGNFSRKTELSGEEAVAILAAACGVPAVLEREDDLSFLIYPLADGIYRPAYRVRIRLADMHYETGIIDAIDGTVLLRDTNYKISSSIGLGRDYHGVNRKFPHFFENGFFYLWDDKGFRPTTLITYDMRTGGYVGRNNNEYWENNGTMISAHYHAGLTYDFVYLFFNRKGLDDNNRNTLVLTHRSDARDNASWNGTYISFYLPGNRQAQYAAALDVVAHEFAHGITQFSNDLVYSFQSGALNESFSDIIGAGAEFFWHPQGSGLFKADWYIGEDAFPNYNFGIQNGLVRYLADPNQFSQFGNPSLPDPCHLAQYYNLPFEIDRGGVHINATIYAHAFYLLAAGGTNRVSGKSVSGIGIDKALRIFYRAWVYKLTSTSQFVHAAQALLDSARELYGQSSGEYQQTIRAMEAIGWIVN